MGKNTKHKSKEHKTESHFLDQGNERIGLLRLLFLLMGKKVIADCRKELRKKLARLLAHQIPKKAREDWDWKIYNSALILSSGKEGNTNFPTSLNESSIYYGQLLLKPQTPENGHIPDALESDIPPSPIVKKRKPNSFPLNEEDLEKLTALFGCNLNRLLEVFLPEHGLPLTVLAKLRYIEHLDQKDLKKLTKRGEFDEEALKVIGGYIAKKNPAVVSPLVAIRLKPKSEPKPQPKPRPKVIEPVVDPLPKTSCPKPDTSDRPVEVLEPVPIVQDKPQEKTPDETWIELSVDMVSKVRGYWNSSIYSGMTYDPYDSISFLLFAYWGLSGCIFRNNGTPKVSPLAYKKLCNWIDKDIPAKDF